MRDFQGRVVLITGAAGGLGRALCHSFAAVGAQVGALDIDETALAELRAEWPAGQQELRTAACDLTDERSCLEAVRRLERELGPTYCLINNAGITHLKNFAADQAAAVRRVMAVNFEGAVHATAAVLDSVVEHGGLIVVLSSVAGYAPVLGRTAYCASKHALHGFFTTLRCELRQSGAGVLIVCPSFIATGIRDRYGEDPAGESRGRTVGGEDTPEQVAEQIVEAARRNRRMLTTGRVGKLAWWGQRWAPRLYERMMLRSIRDE